MEDTPTDDLALLADLHADGARQGPGGEEETRLALRLAGLEGVPDLRVADIGCGTGASTLVLARALDAWIVAVDLVPAFLAQLEEAAAQAGLGERIETLAAPMEVLPVVAEALDAIWSEGAIYCMGFAAGVAAWRPFLKPGGVLAVSELTWLTATRPAELQAHWDAEYPEVATASAKMAVLERAGFTPIGYFPLPEGCWLDGYYRPLRARFPAFLARHGHSDAAKAVVAAEEAEIALYERHREHVSYGFYIARKTGG
jgi:SAM-dependent methyltransferase